MVQRKIFFKMLIFAVFQSSVKVNLVGQNVAKMKFKKSYKLQKSSATKKINFTENK